MQLRRATPADLPAIEALLTANKLPVKGVREALAGFVVAEEKKELVGVIGVEGCGSQLGLLRSAVVTERARGKGVGRDLVERVIEDSRSNGLSALYLLTETAERYFPAFGFAVVDRASVPEPVRQTYEFREACPSGATVMALQLRS